MKNNRYDFLPLSTFGIKNSFIKNKLGVQRGTESRLYCLFQLFFCIDILGTHKTAAIIYISRCRHPHAYRFLATNLQILSVIPGGRPALRLRSDRLSFRISRSVHIKQLPPIIYLASMSLFQPKAHLVYYSLFARYYVNTSALLRSA